MVSGTQILLTNATIGGVVTSGVNTVKPVNEFNFDGSTIDSGSLGYNASFVGSNIGYSPASKIGQYALNLTGSNSYVEVPSNVGGYDLNSTSATTGYTVSAWVNASSFANASATIFSTRNLKLRPSRANFFFFVLMTNSAARSMCS